MITNLQRRDFQLRSKSRTSICSSHLSSLDSSPVSDTRSTLASQNQQSITLSNFERSGVDEAQCDRERPLFAIEAAGETVLLEVGGLFIGYIAISLNAMFGFLSYFLLFDLLVQLFLLLSSMMFLHVSATRDIIL